MNIFGALTALLTVYDHLATGGAKEAADKLLHTALPIIASVAPKPE